jgi:4-alpha-glucanotransferase
LCAVAPTTPQGASPYYPTSRRFRNPLYLRIEEVPGAELLGDELAKLAAAGRGLNDARIIDRDLVFRLKDEALRKIWAARPRADTAYETYCREQGYSLWQFATFCALAEKFGDDWHHWPAEYRRPDAPAVQRFANEHDDQLRYHQWLQWLLDEQLGRVARKIDVVQDLPIGISPGGADAWAWQDLLAAEMTIGAPPDAFNSAGQDWQLPPFVPWKLRAARYRPLVETIRASLRHAAGLRIDHVMGLFRLWWVPRGLGPREGTYIRYPADDLLGIVALESHRAGATIVGEDLGTVEPGVRDRLARRGVLSCRLLYFEDKPPPAYPRLSLATITTHDLPTVAGLWSGADHSAHESLGLPPNSEIPEVRQRLARLLQTADDAPVEDVIEKAYRLLGEASSLLVAATLDDAQGVWERPNMPGTIHQWPNWSLALPAALEEMETQELPRRIAQALEGAGGAGRGAAAI